MGHAASPLPPIRRLPSCMMPEFGLAKLMRIRHGLAPETKRLGPIHWPIVPTWNRGNGGYFRQFRAMAGGHGGAGDHPTLPYRLRVNIDSLTKAAMHGKSVMMHHPSPVK
jgi:hypothetical protein